MPFNVLIACHCKSEYLTKNPVIREWRRCKDKLGLLTACSHPTIQWESTEPVQEMQWLDPDPSCPQDSQQYHSWSLVPANHYDIVWSMYCSVYEYLTTPTRIHELKQKGVEAFYHNVWEALKPGGAFVVVTDTRFGVALAEQEERAVEFVGRLEDPWTVTLVPTESLPFVVRMYGESHALVFMKKAN